MLQYVFVAEDEASMQRWMTAIASSGAEEEGAEFNVQSVNPASYCR